MVELGTLGFVHGHGVHGFQLLQPAGRNPADAAGAVAAGKGDPQRVFGFTGFGPVPGHVEGNADIPIHQTQIVVVAGNQHRPAGVPAFRSGDQLFRQQMPGNPVVQTLHPPGALTQGTENLEVVEGVQNLNRQSVPVFARTGFSQAMILHPFQVMAITDWRRQLLIIQYPPLPGIVEGTRCAGNGMAVNQRLCFLRIWPCFVAIQPDHILELCLPDLA